jgi:subfamily B ATP-binding cassette protein MsbA
MSGGPSTLPDGRPRGHSGGDQPTEPVFTVYRRLLVYLRPHWVKTTIALALLAATSFGRAVPIRIIGLAVDAAKEILVVPTGLGSADFRPLIVLAAAYAGVLALTGVFGFFSSYLLAQVGQRIIFDLRRNLNNHLQRLSLRYYEGERTGEIISRVMGDVQAVESSLLGPLQSLVNDFSRIGGILTFTIAMDWRLTLMVVAVAPLVATFVYYLGGKIRVAFRTAREKVADLTSVLHDGISGIRVVRGFAREPEQARQFDATAEESYEWNVRAAKLVAVARPVMRLLTASGGIALILYGGWQLARGNMSEGDMTSFALYLRDLYRPLLGLGRTYSMIQRAMAAAERVFEIIDTEPEIVDAPDARDVPEVRGRVEFRDVSFAYDEEIPVLDRVSLRAQSGEMIAIVGPSGAGKSTLVNLIPRFYEVSDGAITVDGHDVRDLKQRSLRRHIAMVMQETFLFNTTVSENIRYSKPEATDEEIVAAAKAANAHDFITEMPEGYETVIGERGVKLSGGERQRMSIARAILSDPRILILDEATSSVDSETEILIQQAIDRLVAERTTFCIAHRLSTVQNADRILVLDEGRVVEEGSHEELMARGGLYRRLYETQFRLALPETAAPDAPLSVAEDDDVGLVDFDADDEVPI